MTLTKENVMTGERIDMHQGDTTYNDGTAGQVSQWAFGSTSLANDPGDRLRFQGTIAKLHGYIGFDSIHLSTRERCSPR